MNVLDESPWEITNGLQKPFIFDINIAYKVVKNKDVFPHYPIQQKDKKAYEIQTKPETAQPVVIGPPPQIEDTQTEDQLDSSPITRSRGIPSAPNVQPTTLSGTTRVEPDSMQAWTRARSLD
jgi:hypothetical protein